MHRLLIVDDEPDVVEYFSHVLQDRSDLALEVHTSSSGRSALALLERLRFDIVLTDIRMPEMNGLQLFERIRARWSECRVVFLTGVMEFEPLYNVMRTPGVRYITKLEPTRTIVATISDVVAEIDTAYRRWVDRRKAADQLREARPLVQNRCLQDILTGVADDREETARRIAAVELPLDPDAPTTLLGATFDHRPTGDAVDSWETAVYTLKHVAGGYLGGAFVHACFHSEENYLVWLLQRRKGTPVAVAASLRNGILECIQRAATSAVGTTITVACSAPELELAHLPPVYAALKRRLGYRSHIVPGSIFTVCTEEHEPHLCRSAPAATIPYTALERSLELGNRDAFFDAFQALPALGRRGGGRSFPEHASFLEAYTRVVGLYLTYANESGVFERFSACVDLHRLVTMSSHTTWDEACDHLKSAADHLFQIRFCDEQRMTHRAVARVQRRIHADLSSDLSLITLADQVDLNPTYLSRLFRDTTGYNLSTYIFNARMACAGKLLRTSESKIVDIAARVGYDTASSFTRAFRKHTGVSPNEFRHGAAGTVMPTDIPPSMPDA